MMNDLKFALRQLRKNPGFTAVAVLTLALGIGACTTTFSLVNAVVLRPLAFKDPEQLVWMQNREGGSLSNQASRVDNILDWRAKADSFSEIAAFNPFYDLEPQVLTGNGRPQRVHSVHVSQNFLGLLGVSPILGRSFVEEECLPNGQSAAILSHAIWQDRFAGDASIVGRTVQLNNKAIPVIGVLPQDAQLDLVLSPGQKPEVLLPFALSGKILEWGNAAMAIGRLKPGSTLEQAREEMAVISPQLIEANPDREGYSEKEGPVLALLDSNVRGQFRKAFLLLSFAVLFVWLIACINLSNLLLARADARRQEFSMRTALGASRWRLLRQTMTESLALAVTGCLLGMAIAWLGVATLSKIQAFSIPLLDTATLDLRTLAIAATMACLSAVLCGTLPALQLWRRDAGGVLQESGSRGNTGRASARVRRVLVVSEIALACVLLVGAGLLTRSFMKVMQVDLGFETEQVFSWRVDKSKLDSPTAWNAYFNSLKERIAAVPGVDMVGLSDTVPMGYKRHWPVTALGVDYQEGDPRGGYARFVDHQALQGMKTPLLRGRYFQEQDRLGAEKVVIVSETLAKEAWKGEDPMGRLAEIAQGQYKVVGIVADVAHRLQDRPRADVYLSIHQWEKDHGTPPNLVLRAKGAESPIINSVRSAIQDYDPTLPSNAFTSLDAIVDQAIAPRRLVTGILSAFSIFALLLAAIGLYGLIAYSVNRRTREMGIRLAIGAQKVQVLWLVISDVLRMSSIGIVVGLIGAFFLTHLLHSQLFGITASDPMTYLVTAVILGGVALLAAWLPARKAAQTAPIEALRTE